MPKALKRFLITLLIIVLVGGGIVGGLILYRDLKKEPVKVYAVTDFAMTEYWGDSSQAYGMVTTDKLQDVFISDTQQVSEIFVEPGQTVKVGDPLLAYDTTLSDIDLEQAEINLQKLRITLEDAKLELDNIINMRPHYTILITPDPIGVEYIPQPTPSLISGTGTKEDPFYYLWGADDTLTPALAAQWFPVKPAEPEEPVEPAPEPVPEEGTEGEPAPEEPQINYNESYVVLIVRQYNALNAPISAYWGLRLDKSSGEVRIGFYQPVLSDEIQQFEVEPEPYYQDYGSAYTAAELAQMRAEKEQEIKDLEVTIQLAEVEYARLQNEVNDGVIRATIDGTVKDVLDPDEAYMMNEPVIHVSGGGGYYIDVAMSELELGTVTVGQTVEVMSWETYSPVEGTIVEISEYPVNNANSWSNGNTNVSYYPFRVFVDESAQLRANEYVDVTYQNTVQDGNSLYLENQFIRTENGRSYVYVRNEEGLLEKRTVQTGRSLYGSYTQIRGGITAEDYVAFPYGKDVVDGAETSESTVEEFYGW